MRAVQFQATKATGLPLQCCGGVVVAPGDTLLVRADLALAVKRSAPWLHVVGEPIAVPKLAGGVYELRKSGPSVEPQAARIASEASPEPAPEPQDAPAHVSESEPPLQAVTADRSMARAGKGKSKRK